MTRFQWDAASSCHERQKALGRAKFQLEKAEQALAVARRAIQSAMHTEDSVPLPYFSDLTQAIDALDSNLQAALADTEKELVVLQARITRGAV